MKTLDWTDINDIAQEVANQMIKQNPGCNILTFTKGGLISTYLVAMFLPWSPQVVSLSKLDLQSNLVARKFPLPTNGFVIIDDVLDTGKTILSLEAAMYQHYNMDILQKSFYFLVDKSGSHREFKTFTNFNFGTRIEGNPWVRFPWCRFEEKAQCRLPTT